MDRVSVLSNDLASIGYDSQSATMEVEFSNGLVFQYFGVSPYLHETLITSKEKDIFFHEIIETEIFCWLPVVGSC